MTWTKRFAYAAGLGLVAVIGSPIKQNWRPLEERRDGFPLSYYPMFSEKRGRTGTVNHLVGLDANGDEIIVPHHYAGAGGLNQVRRQITRHVSQGRADRVARTVARRITNSRDPLMRSIERVQVVTSKHRYDDFFAGNRTPRSRRVRAEAPVPRGLPQEGL